MISGITSNLFCSQGEIFCEDYADHNAIYKNSATTIKKENVK